MPRLVISAAHKSSGKTTVSIGLCAALADRGLKVQPFKKGPDYIDPMWLSAAAGRSCRNLDFYTMAVADIRDTFGRHAADADISLVEGNKGLYDGVDLEGSNSTAALARWLEAPVVLVIDTMGMTRGIAPLLLGYQAFEPDVRIGGVILNKVSGPRHEKKLRDTVAHYTSIPVLGAIPRDPGMEIVERHIGLIPANEAAETRTVVAGIRDIVAAHVDLDAVLALAGSVGECCVEAPPPPAVPAPDLRIGIARDAAFGFYYPDDIDAFRQGGAELVAIDTLHDARLPEGLDGLFIGGGFPETNAAALEANASLRAEIHAAISAGLPAYAECGGLMYLSRGIVWQGRRHDMVGVLPGTTVMHPRPMGRGYVRLRPIDLPWPKVEDGPGVIAAHEFHHSALEDIDEPLRFAYEVLRGAGIDGRHDGIVVRNCVANYAHLRSTGAGAWVPRFLAFVRACKSGP